MKFKRIIQSIVLTLILGFMFGLAADTWAQANISPKTYKVAILPFLIHSQENLDYLRDGIFDILASRISVDERITVIDRSLVERALYEERPMRLDEAVATKIGMKVGADYIILGSITKVGDYISLDSRLLSITEEKPPLGVFTQAKGIDDVMVKIGDFAQDIGSKILGRRATAGRATGGRVAQPGKSPFIQRERTRLDEEGFKKSQTFSFEIKGLDIGDVDGDKKNEVVVMDRHNVYIFKYDGEKLSLFQKIEAGYEYDLLTLDVADINRNGHAEIIVTAVVNDDLRSFILEYEEGRFKKITEKAGWYFRVLEHPKEGPILMGQMMGSEAVPVGPVYRMVWKKKSFEKGPKMPFPRETRLFSVAMGDIRGTGKPDIILFDPQERLRIFSEDGKEVWKGKERFGGTNNFYDTYKKKLDGFRPAESPAWREYITARILVRDLNGDGIPQVIINKNESSSGTFFDRVRSFEKGEIYNLFWEESGLTTGWKTREITGYIIDYQVKDVENTGQEELVVAVILPSEGGLSGALSKKTESSILFFKLN